MAKLNRGGEPTSGGGNTNYFKPDGKVVAMKLCCSQARGCFV